MDYKLDSYLTDLLVPTQLDSMRYQGKYNIAIVYR